MCGLLQVSSPAPAPPPCCPARAPASTARRWWCRRSASGWWPRPPAPPSPSRWTPAPSPTVSSPVTGSWSRLHGVSTPRCCSELRRVAAAPVDGGQDDGGAGERGPHVRPGRQEGVHRPQVQCSTVQYSAVQCSNSTLCPGVSPGSSTSRCPASTRAPSTTASPGTPPGLCCQTASSSRSDVTVNNNSAEENNGETFIEIKVVCVSCVV